MSNSKYTKLPGSERKPLAGAVKTGAVDPNQVIQVTVTLRPRAAGKKQPSLDNLVASGQRISREDYAARYGADPKDVQKVSAFAAAHNLSVGQVNLGARSLVLTGKTGDFSQAFQTGLERYEFEGRTFRHRTGDISIPEELSKVVVSVHGLDDRPQAKAHFRVGQRGQASPRAAAGALTALQVAKAYSFPANLTGAGEAIALIELGGGFKQADLNKYFSGLGVSPAPTVTAVSVDGAQNAPTGSTNGPDTEVMLDIEVAGAVAPRAHIVVYFAPNSDSGFLDAINRAVNDTVNKPSVVSISWGGPESSWTAQSLKSYNGALQAAAAVGVTVCVAAGDNGSDDGVGDGKDHVDFPASSPYALACGGTTLTLSGSKITKEVVWNELAKNEGATGGGVSATFAVPSWQSGVSVSPGRKLAGRGLPDVAGDADPTTGYEVQVDGSSFAVGGTSAVAPLWAGLLALCNQSLGKAVGYLNPSLYQTIALQTGTFNDITSGNNGDYSARPGWDACTGWGSPDGAAILKALGGTTTPTPPPTPTPTPVPPPKKHKKRERRTHATAKKHKAPPKKATKPKIPKKGAGRTAAKKKKR